MITDSPTPEDYARAGTELLISAWCSATALLMERLESFELIVSLKKIESDSKEKNLNDYFESIQTNMRSSLALVQQGVEFHLKSRICEVSPFLLI